MSSNIISNEVLLKVAGQARYEDGVADFENKLLSQFQSEGDHVRAKFGEYDTTVRFKGDHIEGSCSCPDSDGFEFCRHCVALTLHSNKVTQQLFALSKGPDKSKIFAYLLQLDKQELAKQFLSVIEQDDQLRKKFLLKASLDTQKIDYSALRSEVTKITKAEKQLFSKRQVKHFFARIEAFLQEILDYGHYEEPEKMAKVIEYCLSRINKLLRSMDDSGNQREATTNLLKALYSQLLTAIPGGIEQHVKRFYRHWLTDEYALLGDDLDIFFESHSNVATKQFTRLVEESWARVEKSQTLAAQSSSPGMGGGAELEKWQVEKLAQYQLELAKITQNKDREIQLRNMMATNLDDFLLLAELQHENGDLPQAIRSARTALNMAPESQLALEFLLGLMELKNDLIEPFHDLFEHYPDQVLDTYLAYAKRHDRFDETLDRCIKFLTGKEKRYSHELVSVLLKRERLEDAVQLAKDHSLKAQDLIDIARSVSDSNPAASVQVYKQAIAALVERGLTKSNEQAINYIKEMMPLAGGKQDDSFVDYVENLAIRYRSKSAFIQQLKLSLNAA